MIRVATTGSDADGWFWRLVDTDTGAIVHEGTVPYTTEQSAHARGARQLGALHKWRSAADERQMG